MAAYEFFAATTTNLFIENIKTKAQAYGWTIDFFGLYSGNNRLHLHNADGAHFEIWYSTTAVVNLVSCTGYDSGAIPTAQPGVSATQVMSSNWMHLIAVGPHAIFIKLTNNVHVSGYRVHQFGYINDKIGSWSGGNCISNAVTSTTFMNYLSALWSLNNNASANSTGQVLINGVWSSNSAITNISWPGGTIKPTVAATLHSKMPFAYSGGILPVPLLLTQVDPVTTSLFHPIGYAPDVRFFNGGNTYVQLEEITINGEKWLALNQEETFGTFVTVPNLLIRLAA